MMLTALTHAPAMQTAWLDVKAAKVQFVPNMLKIPW